MKLIPSRLRSLDFSKNYLLTFEAWKRLLVIGFERLRVTGGVRRSFWIGWNCKIKEVVNLHRFQASFYFALPALFRYFQNLFLPPRLNYERKTNSIKRILNQKRLSTGWYNFLKIEQFLWFLSMKNLFLTWFFKIGQNDPKWAQNDQ